MKQEIKNAIGTIVYCMIFYMLGIVEVHLFWPILSPLVPLWINPTMVAIVTAFFLLFVITHMEFGHLDPHGYPFLYMYMVVCLGFGFSTLHPSQYNEGTACMEMAFVTMLIWKVFNKFGSNT